MGCCTVHQLQRTWANQPSSRYLLAKMPPKLFCFGVYVQNCQQALTPTPLFEKLITMEKEDCKAGKSLVTLTFSLLHLHNTSVLSFVMFYPEFWARLFLSVKYSIQTINRLTFFPFKLHYFSSSIIWFIIHVYRQMLF